MLTLSKLDYLDNNNHKQKEQEQEQEQEDYDYNTRVLSGLDNLHNTCYINSIIQVLCGTDILTMYFLNDKFKEDLFDNLDKNNENLTEKKLHRLKNRSVTYIFYRLIKQMWRENCLIRPCTFKKLVQEKIEMTRGDNQEDASEFLIFLLEEFEKDLKCDCNVTNDSIITPKMEEFIDRYSYLFNMTEEDCNEEENNNRIDELLLYKKQNFNEYQKYKYLEFWKKYLKQNGGNYSIIIDIFTFTNITSIRCSNCENTSIMFEPDNMMKLSVPYSKEDINLIDLIKSESETVESLIGDNKYHCNICDSKQDAYKNFKFWDFPERLIIHLKLFEHKIININGEYRQITKKINTTVNYPMVLDLNGINENNNDIEYKYELYALVKHMGSVRGGHYVSYVKNPLNYRWFYFDDESVYPASENRVKTESPYILFYRRIINDGDSSSDED
jgi:ubiquitin carboxyl-terminal hydrolase 8